MSASTILGLAASGLVAIGLFGLLTHASLLRKVLAFNVLGGGVFLIFGLVARRGAAGGLAGDPVPQAMAITGLVVAFAGTALAIVLILRMFQMTGAATIAEDP